MVRSPRSRSLVVHAWLEEDHGVVLRARITDISEDIDDRRVAAIVVTVDAVCDAVRSWAKEIVAR